MRSRGTAVTRFTLVALSLLLMPAVVPAQEVAPESLDHLPTLQFETPAGLASSRSSLRGFTGPVEMVLFEPDGGMYDGLPNSAFLAFSVYDAETTPDSAISTIVATMADTFGGTSALEGENLFVQIDGQTVPGVVLLVEVLDVDLETHLFGWTSEDWTLVLVRQGRPEELEALGPLFDQAIASFSVE